MATPEERLHDMIVRRFDRIEDMLTKKVDYPHFNEFKNDTKRELDEIREDLDQLKSAAITGDQVTGMIGNKLQESQARGVTSRERLVRYAVALIVMATFILQLFREFGSGG